MVGWHVAASAQAVVGQPAPDFTITDTRGHTRSLAELKGKFVVLEWFNYDCPFTKKHYDTGNMQRLQLTYTVRGVVWFSIDSSAPGKQGHLSAKEANRLSAKKHVHATAILLDPDGKVGRLYGAKTTPHMFIVNPDGKLLYTGAIDDKRSVDPADVKTAKNYVQTALDEALVGKPVSTPETQSYGCSIKY